MSLRSEGAGDACQVWRAEQSNKEQVAAPLRGCRSRTLNLSKFTSLFSPSFSVLSCKISSVCLAASAAFCGAPCGFGAVLSVSHVPLLKVSDVSPSVNFTCAQDKRAHLTRGLPGATKRAADKVWSRTEIGEGDKERNKWSGKGGKPSGADGEGGGQAASGRRVGSLFGEG